MKFNKSIEQATFVLIILALQKKHSPLKSQVLSEILNVSDSYLKKILMKLSKSNLISSTASKNGGYILKKNIENISLLDVINSIDSNIHEIKLYNLGNLIFDDDKHVKEGEEKIKNLFLEANTAFNEKLSNFKLSELLYENAYKNGEIDWIEKLKEKKNEKN